MPEDTPPHYILAVMPPEGQPYLEKLINHHLSECVGCQAWKEQHPGNTKKEMLPKEIFKRWGVDFDDMNIAEAYVLARIAYAVDTERGWASPENLTQFQKDVVTALDGRTEWIPIPQRRLVRVGK
jgi:hypothetical protein